MGPKGPKWTVSVSLLMTGAAGPSGSALGVPRRTVSSRAQGSGSCDVVTQREGALGFGVGQTWVQVEFLKL